MRKRWRMRIVIIRYVVSTGVMRVGLVSSKASWGSVIRVRCVPMLQKRAVFFLLLSAKALTWVSLQITAPYQTFLSSRSFLKTCLCSAGPLSSSSLSNASSSVWIQEIPLNRISYAWWVFWQMSFAQCIMALSPVADPGGKSGHGPHRSWQWSLAPLGDRKSNDSIVKLSKCKDFGPPYRCRLRIWPSYGKIAH